MASSSLSEAVDQTNSGAAGTDTGHLTATSGPLEGDSPPPYGGCHGRIDQVDEVGTGASITEDGRVDIQINQKAKGLSSLLVPALRSQLEQTHNEAPPYVPPNLHGPADELQAPSLNVVVHVVGSRGDVQPFVALGKVLRERHGHRVRLATHPVFRKFVEENGLEFFDIAGDPSELMAFMVKNPGLMPGFDTLRSGDVGHRRHEIGTMIKRCWRSCIETGDGSGNEAKDSSAEDWTRITGDNQMSTSARPFVADAIIANPPSFAHIHCAEKLGIPLHMMFTMPWSPTQSFPHPLANILSSDATVSMTNFMSYALVDMMTWQGLGDVINRFREKTLGLEPISLTSGPGILARLHVPYTYCWSPSLIPKPHDWASYISVSGFYFLSSGSDYTPEPALKTFLASGPPPIYIGFGSIVVDDPNAMTRLIFDAVRKSGQRALVSKGWGGFGADELGVPENVFMLGNVPHDWLFKRVSCVVHHGGAGTTAAGIACGRPTVIVPFFGDQPFWGAMVARAGAGPNPIAYKDLTSDVLADSIRKAQLPETISKAREMSERIEHETGCENGAQSFHQHLDLDQLRCQLCPTRAAAWRVRDTEIRLSPFAAAVLGRENLLDFKDLRLYRPLEYELDDGPWDPITGGASALVGTMGSMAMGIADLPVATLKAMNIHPEARRSKIGKNKQPHSPKESSNETKERLSSQECPSNEEEQLALVQEMGMKVESDGHETQDGLPPGDPPGSAPSQSSASTATAEKQKPFKFNEADLDNALSTGKGALRFASAGVKSPMDFTLSLAKGFHNAPKLYGDETVRKPEKITSLSSGLRAAGKELGYGFYDGITGLVTQPMAGAKKEGASGFVKGFGKGIGGIVFKPGAAIWGVPGYTSKGMYKELQKQFGPSVDGYIIASRAAQGYADLRSSGSAEHAAIISDWKDIREHIYKKKTTVGQDKMQEVRQRLLQTGATQRQSSAETVSRNDTASCDLADNEQTDPELEEAIRRSVADTSQGDPEQDAAIERAIRASLAELAAARARGADENEIQQAMQASVSEIQESAQAPNVEIIPDGSRERTEASIPPSEGHDTEHSHDAELLQALDASRKEHERASDNLKQAEDEEEIVMKYVMRQSKAEEEARQNKVSGQ